MVGKLQAVLLATSASCVFLLSLLMPVNREHKIFSRELCYASNSSPSSQTRFKTRIIKLESYPVQCVYDCISGFNIRCLNLSTDTRFENFQVGRKVFSEDDRVRHKAFARIYRKREWIEDRSQLDNRYKSVQSSGAGSTLDWAQEAVGILHLLISDLKHVLNKDKISILDIPCGDMVWMNRFLQTRTDIEYTGMDIVPRLVWEHTQRYSHLPHLTFVQHDIVARPLQRSYDLILCRMLLQHLTTEDAMTVLGRFQASGSRLLLTTTFPGVRFNLPLPIGARGRFRMLNLEVPPFSLQSPICMTRDGDPVNGILVYLSLWKLPLMSYKNCHASKISKPAGSIVDFFVCS